MRYASALQTKQWHVFSCRCLHLLEVFVFADRRRLHDLNGVADVANVVLVMCLELARIAHLQGQGPGSAAPTQGSTVTKQANAVAAATETVQRNRNLLL